jgi:hypothetical protein
MSYSLFVENRGLDEARNVVLDIRETLFQAPGFRIIEPGCDGLRCFWDIIEVGQYRRVTITSDVFEVQTATEHGIEAVVSSDVEDFHLIDNQISNQHTIQPLSNQCSSPVSPDWDLSGVGAGAGCFIATATYGSKLHPDVQTLREFRDNVLLKTGWGRALVDFYYRHSPDLACYIAERDGLRILTRGLLVPVIFAVAYPLQALLVLVAVFSLLIAVILVLYRRTSTD